MNGNVANTTSTPSLKINITNCLKTLIDHFNKTTPNGKIVFYKEIPGIQPAFFEKNIMSKLANFKRKGEIYKLNVEEAIMIVMTEINILALTNDPNEEERQIKMKKIYDFINNVTIGEGTPSSLLENTFIPVEPSHSIET
jgi:hypothetical protein